jgi:lambda family phage portal protein
MNPVEKTIAMISPRWAAGRAFYRSMLDMESQARSFNAARGGRRGDGWYAAPTSVNAELGGHTAAVIRDRARDLVRNNPYAAGFPGMLASKIVGAGIQPRLALTGQDTKAQRQNAIDIWNRFSDNCDPEGQNDFYGLQHLAARAFAESGEVLIRSIRLRASEGVFPLQIAVLEADYLDTSKNGTMENGNFAIQGVEFDKRGRRAAYWLYDHHPGDTMFRGTKGIASTRVDGSEVDHIFERLRPGQVRGVSPFAAVAMKLRDLDDYDDAELMRKKIASCFAAFVRRPGGGATSPLVPQTNDTDGRKIERINPAMIKYLQPGEEVSFGDPPSADGYTEYHFGQLYAVAAGLGCTFEQLTGNLKGVNLSSIRVGENRFRDLLDHWQQHVFIFQMCQRSWNRVGQIARITGDLALKDPWNSRWIAPRWRSPDPKTDVEVAKNAARSLQMSPLDTIAMSGNDPIEVLEETAEFNALVDELGIITDMDPRRVGLTSAPQVSAPAEPDPAPADA